jgi:hypothetical protein
VANGSQEREIGAVDPPVAGSEGLGVAGEDLRDGDIHDRDLEWLRSADVLVAEVTTPSLGVGYEIGQLPSILKEALAIS